MSSKEDFPASSLVLSLPQIHVWTMSRSFLKSHFTCGFCFSVFAGKFDAPQLFCRPPDVFSHVALWGMTLAAKLCFRDRTGAGFWETVEACCFGTIKHLDLDFIGIHIYTLQRTWELDFIAFAQNSVKKKKKATVFTWDWNKKVNK